MEDSLTLKELVAELKANLDTAPAEHNIDKVKAIISRFNNDRSEWGTFAVAREGEYTRNLIDQGNGIYNLLILVWAPGMKSCIHSHAGSSCFLRVLEGELTENLYEKDEA